MSQTVERGAQDEPSAWAAPLMLASAVAVHLAILTIAYGYWDTLIEWVDNQSFVRIAAAIHRGTWVCGADDCTWHLWGLPFVMAGVAAVFRVSDLAALVGISIGASLLTAVLLHRLYGGWVASATVAVCLMWTELSARGGSEPLFMGLLYGAFAASRADRVRLGSALAALSAAVRPVGVILVAAMAIDAAWRRNWKDLLTLVVVTALLATVYLAAVAAIAGNPFATSAGYLNEGWGRFPIGLPFGRVAVSMRDVFSASMSQGLRTCAWIAVGVVSLWTMARKADAVPARPERVFAIGYLAFVFCGTHEALAWYVPRFILPVAPLMFQSLRRWIPRRRVLLWAAALIEAAIGAVGTDRFLALIPRW